MAEDLIIPKTTDKKELYEAILPQVKALLSAETDTVANMANFCAAIKETFGYLWVGFYLVKDNELVLGPFQGPVACTRIAFGRGVCGASWKQNETLIVEDVEKFPGHIACSSLSKSEIVIPIHKDGVVIGVLDVDSVDFASFDQIDADYMQELLDCIKF
jgi:L-methionine (R)-S-oxide reductase